MNKTKTYIISIVSVLFIAVVFFVQNADAYVLLEELGGIKSVSGGNITGYFESMYKLIIGLVVVLAVLVLTWGGIEYMSSVANPSAKASAKTRIWAAIGGLLLALFSWILLNTINPDLLIFSI